MIAVGVAASVDADLLAAVNALIPQVSSSADPLALGDLERIVADGGSTLLVARDESANVVGMLTLVVFAAPTGVRAWVEDVVTDDAARGAGVATSLVQFALEEAARQGAKTVDLTSRPLREAANRLYVRVGFELRETNVYRYNLDDLR
jgi:ribosomal protein S18 acetylase RimI-like enzyme